MTDNPHQDEVSVVSPRVVPGLAETEKGFQGWIVDLAELHGWAHYHPWLSIRSPRGWPDLALCRPPRLILAEVKGPNGKVSPDQRRWLDLLDGCPGVESYLWYPADRDRITAILR